LLDTFEVGIVGAGVAGSTCAQVLGEAGVKVALFDHSYPREKPCGGLIEERVVEEFQIPNELLENEVKWVLAERFKLRSKFPYIPPQFLVSRKDLDYYLLQAALRNKDVAFFDEKVIRLTEGKNEWLLNTGKERLVRVKVLIGADGCPSLTRKSVFKPIPSQFLATTVGYDFSCSPKKIHETFDENTVEVYYSRKYVPKGGFLWIFPKRSRINVGIGSTEKVEKLKQSLDKFIVSHSAGRRLANLEGHPFAHMVPTIWKEDFFDLPCTGENWALVGDAAGHVNPIGGAGIYYAMKGGVLCASAFLKGDIRLFEKYWRREYGYELRYGARNVLRHYSSVDFFPWIKFMIDNLFYKASFK